MSEVRVAFTVYPRTDDSISNFLQKLLRAVDDDLGRASSWTWPAGTLVRMAAVRCVGTKPLVKSDSSH